MSDMDGNIVKIVDRSTFSKYDWKVNFSKEEN